MDFHIRNHRPSLACAAKLLFTLAARLMVLPYLHWDQLYAVSSTGNRYQLFPEKPGSAALGGFDYAEVGEMMLLD